MMTEPEQIIILWSQGKTGDQIADITGYSRDAVFFHIRKARECGDCRAARREYQAPARVRRIQIKLLRDLRLPTKTIADMVGCTKRTVQLRLRELEEA